MSSEVPSGPDESIPTQREVYHELELTNARISSETSVVSFDKDTQEKLGLISAELMKEAESLIDDNEDEVEDEAQLHFLLAKLNTAFAITKDPQANELRRRLEQKFGPLSS